MPTGTRSEVIDAEVAGLLKQSGQIAMTYAPESGSDQTRRYIKKKVDADKMVQSIYDCMEANLNIMSNLIIGFPHETKELVAAHSIVDIRVRAMPEALDNIPAETDDGGDMPDCLISATGPLGGRRMIATSAGVHPLESDDVMLEDIYACEAVQKGMASPKFKVGPMSKFESSVTFHQQQVLDFMPSQSAEAQP